MIFQSLRIRKGESNFCPICKKRYQAFEDFGVPPRLKVLCPECKSLERHRLQFLYIKNKTNVFTKKNFSLLHVAPEIVFYDYFIRINSILYTGVDLDPNKRGLGKKIDQGDILNLRYEENSFDGIICNHVLEHIPDDIKAMSELYRVLKPGGFSILQVPLSNKAATEEDLSIKDPKERLRRYGQHDHVRIYGKDYKQRLMAAGFDVTVDDYVRSNFSDLDIRNYGLMKREDLYIGRK